MLGRMKNGSTTRTTNEAPYTTTSKESPPLPSVAEKEGTMRSVESVFDYAREYAQAYKEYDRLVLDRDLDACKGVVTEEIKAAWNRRVEAHRCLLECFE